MLTKKPFGDIITFTRASSGGRFNAQGVYEMVPANQPRIDYDPVTGECKGLLVEEQRTNLTTYSSDFTNSFWVKGGGATVEKNVIAPDGTVTGCTITSAGGIPAIYTTPFVAPADVVSFSIYAKTGGSRPYYQFVVRNNTTLTNVTATSFNSATGVVDSGNWKSTHVGNGWYRLSTTISSGITAGNTIRVYAGAISDLSPAGESWIVWGAQLEAGPFPTSYIPTSGSQVTRAADVASINTLSPWFNVAEGTLFVEVSSVWGNDNRDHQIIGLVGADARQVLGRFSGGSLQVHDGTSFRSLPNALFNTPGSRKVAISYKNGETESPSAINGVSGTYSSDGDVVSNPTAIRIGLTSAGSNVWNGHIKKIQFYPKQKDQAGNASITS